MHQNAPYESYRLEEAEAQKILGPDEFTLILRRLRKRAQDRELTQNEIVPQDYDYTIGVIPQPDTVIFRLIVSRKGRDGTAEQVDLTQAQIDLFSHMPHRGRN